MVAIGQLTQLKEFRTWHTAQTQAGNAEEGLGEVQEMIDICDFAVGLSRQLHGLTIASERPDGRPLSIDYDVAAGRITVAVPGTDPAPLAAGSADGEPPLLLAVGDDVVEFDSSESFVVEQDVINIVVHVQTGATCDT